MCRVVNGFSFILACTQCVVNPYQSLPGRRAVSRVRSQAEAVAVVAAAASAAEAATAARWRSPCHGRG